MTNPEFPHRVDGGPDRRHKVYKNDRVFRPGKDDHVFRPGKDGGKMMPLVVGPLAGSVVVAAVPYALAGAAWAAKKSPAVYKAAKDKWEEGWWKDKPASSASRAEPRGARPDYRQAGYDSALEWHDAQGG